MKYSIWNCDNAFHPNERRLSVLNRPSLVNEELIVMVPIGSMSNTITITVDINLIVNNFVHMNATLCKYNFVVICPDNVIIYNIIYNAVFI